MGLSVELASLQAEIMRGNLSPARYLESAFSLAEVFEFKRLIRIEEDSTPLCELSTVNFSLAQPHRYIEAGAPYGVKGPFWLRTEVVERLHAAQRELQKRLPQHRLHIFDGLRSQTVQSYMRQFEHDAFAKKLGFDLDALTPDQSAAAWKMVNALWAQPSSDPTMPTPHSTGGAVDLTIIDSQGELLEMGAEFDESSPRSLPNYYVDGRDHFSAVAHRHRELLNEVLSSVGFRRLTHEWWHFSFGDQNWAVLESLERGEDVVALYGGVDC